MTHRHYLVLGFVIGILTALLIWALTDRNDLTEAQKHVNNAVTATKYADSIAKRRQEKKDAVKRSEMRIDSIYDHHTAIDNKLKQTKYEKPINIDAIDFLAKRGIVANPSE